MLNLNVLKYIFFHSLCRGVAMYAIVGMWLNAFMQKSELLQKAWTQMRRYTTGSHIAQSVTCLATEACLTAYPGVTSSILVRSHTFMEIGSEIISVIILLPSAESFKIGCCYKRIFCMCTKYWLTA